MKYFMILLLICGAVSPALSQTAADSSKSMEEVVVKEKFKAELNEEKLPVDIQMDFSDLARIPETVSWETIGAAKDERDSEMKDWNAFPFKLIPPEIANIAPQPVKVFRVNFKDLQKWTLNIFTSNGSLFRSLFAEGNPPESIPWDGKGDTGELLIPGEVYSYSFTATDIAGNKRTFPGQTFSQSAVYFTDSTGTWIRIADEKLFQTDDTGLAPGASDYANEIALLFNAYSRKHKLALDSFHRNSEAFPKLLGRTIGIPADSLQAVPGESGAANCLTVYIQ